jgi:ankyrin repeat protein
MIALGTKKKRKKLDKDVKNNTGQTALQLALLKDQNACVKVLRPEVLIDEGGDAAEEESDIFSTLSAPVVAVGAAVAVAGATVVGMFGAPFGS